MILRQSGEDSSFVRALRGHDWTRAELLAAEQVDLLAVSAWQRGSGKRKDYPKPIPRPGHEPESTTYGSGALPIDEMAEWLGWN